MKNDLKQKKIMAAVSIGIQGTSFKDHINCSKSYAILILSLKQSLTSEILSEVLLCYDPSYWLSSNYSWKA